MTAPRFPFYMKYVAPHDVPAWIEAGWVLNPRPLPGAHGQYSVVVEWWREGECVIPGREGQQWTGAQQAQTSTNTERQP
jgi:hypothetical protein